MAAKVREYEELITLQDKAIQALTQANEALVMALDALKKARAEHGFLKPLPGLGSGTTIFPPVQVPYIPYTTPNTGGIQWQSQTGQITVNSVGSDLTAKTVTAQALTQMAQNQKQWAENYTTFLADAKQWKEEHGVPKIGGCCSVCQEGAE